MPRTRVALFGSVLRDDFAADSGVDILVEFLPGHVPGLRFVTIEREFSELLHGRRVDMVTPKCLNPGIRDEVLSAAELRSLQRPSDLVSTEDDAGRECIRADKLE
ncbi:MAG: nucleotidyltransferase domain-containing protein [Acidobacteria bacterium]|nr:nucleotidyltransferase domain-containing protein [Acidobacteriota bacterium]